MKKRIKLVKDQKHVDVDVAFDAIFGTQTSQKIENKMKGLCNFNKKLIKEIKNNNDIYSTMKFE